MGFVKEYRYDNVNINLRYIALYFFYSNRYKYNATWYILHLHVSAVFTCIKTGTDIGDRNIKRKSNTDAWHGWNRIWMFQTDRRQYKVV